MMRKIARGLLSGLAGGMAWIVGMAVFFGPAQAILTNPALQSAKMNAAFSNHPLPRGSETAWIVPVGLLLIGCLWGIVYVWLTQSWSGPWWRRGLIFGALAWTLMVPWFEFYVPWNVLLEPAPLVALELACWAGVILCVGLALAGTETMLARWFGNSTPS